MQTNWVDTFSARGTSKLVAAAYSIQQIEAGGGGVGMMMGYGK